MPHRLVLDSPAVTPARAGVVILGTGSYLPQRVLSNADLEQIVDTSDAWIVERTGVRERRICAPGETTTDMAAAAARRACEAAGIEAGQLDLIIVASVTGETHFPATACHLQARLGAARAWVLDVTLGCAGFVFALSLAASLMRDGRAGRVLVVGADRVSAIADYTDRGTCILFGDGAGAVVLGLSAAGETPHGLLTSALHSDGSKSGLLYRPLDAVASPDNPAHRSSGEPYLYMEGRAVYRHAVQCMAAALREVLEQAQLKLGEIDWIVPHQANGRITDALIARLGVDPARVYGNIERVGNTSAASIPICLDEMQRGGLLRSGQLVLLCTFGTGFTWAAQLVRWGSPATV